MTLLQLILIIIVLYLCIYALISRICKCVEHCATARACSKFRENGVMIKMGDIEAQIAKSNREKENVEKRNNKE